MLFFCKPTRSYNKSLEMVNVIKKETASLLQQTDKLYSVVEIYVGAEGVLLQKR